MVTVDWILHVLEKKELSKWGPSDLWAMTLKTQSEIGLKYDRFGDSYHNPTSIEELKLTFEKVSNQVNNCAFFCFPFFLSFFPSITFY